MLYIFIIITFATPFTENQPPPCAVPLPLKWENRLCGCISSFSDEYFLSIFEGAHIMIDKTDANTVEVLENGDVMFDGRIVSPAELIV